MIHIPEGSYIQLLGYKPQNTIIEGIVGPNSLIFVYVDPLGIDQLSVCFSLLCLTSCRASIVCIKCPSIG